MSAVFFNESGKEVARFQWAADAVHVFNFLHADCGVRVLEVGRTGATTATKILAKMHGLEARQREDGTCLFYKVKDVALVDTLMGAQG